MKSVDPATGEVRENPFGRILIKVESATTPGRFYELLVDECYDLDCACTHYDTRPRTQKDAYNAYTLDELKARGLSVCWHIEKVAKALRDATDYFHKRREIELRKELRKRNAEAKRKKQRERARLLKNKAQQLLEKTA